MMHLAVSNHFGNPDQTDVFVIGAGRRLIQVSAVKDGDWIESPPIGPSVFTTGAPIAASKQFGTDNTTNVFAVDDDLSLNVFGVSGSDRWDGPTAIGAKGFFDPWDPVTPSGQFGTDNTTSLYAVSRGGMLVRASRINGGAWSNFIELGPTHLSSGTYVAVSKQMNTPGQTDVFFIDMNQTLNVVWVVGDPAQRWNGPIRIGAGLKRGGSVAASPQFGIDAQTDVFAVNPDGVLVGFWVNTGNTWNGPVRVGGGFPLDGHVAVSEHFGVAGRTDLFAVDNTGTLNVFWVIGFGVWNGPQLIGGKGIFPPGAPVVASQHFGIANRTDVFAIDKNDVLRVAWADGGNAFTDPKPIASFSSGPPEGARKARSSSHTA